ncbi:MAG: hypothetical protein KGQ46_12055 [Hyphomicrobiales bacterium]|nr:hypothetical protein [Hyphomicrobiales bacterium]MDE2114917.1 hypothetical protein [Hyphomicrobiales bacterium]
MSESAAQPMDPNDPLAGCTLDLLLDGAAQMRPNAPGLRGGPNGPALTIGEIATRVGRLTLLLSNVGLVAGETIALYGAGANETICGLFAACRLGLHVALLPLHMPRDAALERVRQMDAAALLTVSRMGDIDLADLALECALQAQSVRLVGILAGDAPDGTVDLGSAVEPFFNVDLPKPAMASLIITYENAQNGDRAPIWQPVIQQQVKMVTCALTFIEATHIVQRSQLLTTLPPASQAGLVSGPLVMLLSSASMQYHAPFSAAGLQSQIEAMQDGYLIAPLSLLAMIKAEPWFQRAHVSHFIGLSRWQDDGHDFMVPQGTDASIPVIDLHAFGERVNIAVARVNGEAGALLERPRMLNFSGTEILALAVHRDFNGKLTFSGAVT